jgi:hypothetical protein
MTNEPIRPTGPYHDFWLLDRRQRPNGEYDDLLGRRDAPVRFPDDVLRRFNDIWQWIPTLNPDMGTTGAGLNYYGSTVITGESARKLASVGGILADLYRHAPAELVLTGGWCVQLDDDCRPADDGHYEKYLVERDWLVAAFDQLADWGRGAATGPNYVLHLGI